MTLTYLAVCESAARAAGAILREMLGAVNVRYKQNQFDLVTEADISAQKEIERILFGAFPDHRLVGEEGDLTQTSNVGKSEFKWIVDPLDGTTNFVHGMPLFCTSIALARNNELICGVIYNPMTEEFFSAEQNKGAWLNGKRISVSSCKTLSEGLISVGFPTIVEPDSLEIQMLLNTCPRCQAVRRTGSTALNLAFLAAGRLDGCWALKCHAWDIAAGILLVKEAGGKITKPDGKIINLDEDPTPFCAAANEELHNELKTVINIGKK
ncbi:MAG: inositol monophosphatase [Planctomycetaceae bacterium]|jgi:myo-inositol-1(or 4)-monophosphatase|nr:inositol monophosphatase [Planctomycetaceae bacterium]